MSAAIMHNTASLYDFGDYLFKNQTSSRSVLHSNNNTSNNLNNNNNNTSNSTTSPTTTITNSNSQLLSDVIGSSMQSLLANNSINSATLSITATAASATTAAAAAAATNNNTSNNNCNGNNGGASATLDNSNILNNNNFNQVANSAAGVTNSVLLQQHINAVVAQQEQQKKLWIHNALSRAVSHPQNGNVVTLMNTLIENLNGQQNALVENMGGSGAGGCHRKLERTQSEPLPQVNTSRYKTELCRPFEEEGECKYGEKCQFAHGHHELRNIQRHPKYKTEFCRTFHKVGFCPYGPRCNFIHNVDEARIQMSGYNPAYNHLTAAAVAAAAGAAQANAIGGGAYPLPLSPPLSMSTGSDRASPADSLSLSPTNSMAMFPFGDQNSPANSVFQAFTFNTPPASPHSGMSTSPPPSIINSAQIIPTQQQQQQQSQNTLNHHGNMSNVHHHSQIHGKHSTGNLSAAATAAQTATITILSKQNSEESRLPVFNRLSSTVDAFTNLAI